MKFDHRLWDRRIVGLIGAGCAVGTAELTTALLRAPSPLISVADQVIVATPGPIVRFAIDSFGTANRFVLFAAMLVVMVVAALSIGHLRARWVHADIVLFSVFAAIAAFAMLRQPSAVPLAALGSAGLAATVGVAALRTLERHSNALTPAFAGVHSGQPTTTPDQPPDAAPLASPTDPPQPSRREFVVWATGLTAAAIATTATGITLRSRSQPGSTVADGLAAPAASPTGFTIDGLSPLITPNDAFFRIDTAFVPPRVDSAAHEVAITGMVERPFTISYAELVERANVEATVHLACVSNEVGGNLVGNAVWTGVALRELLDEAGVAPDADQVVGRAVDAWTGGFPLDVIYDGRPALVAVTMNGEPLPVAHGFPVRLVVAGLYGYVSDTKWLAEIELTRFDRYDAYWIERGWAREGPVKTQSRIDVPRQGQRIPVGPTVIAGVAWAGERGLDTVEVRVDDGPWQTATLGSEPSRTSWRQWRIAWEAPLGRHQVQVRATDGDGSIQTSQVAPPFPDGATGHHTVHVTVI